MGDRFWKGVVVGLMLVAGVFAVLYELLVRYLGV